MEDRGANKKSLSVLELYLQMGNQDLEEKLKKETRLSGGVRGGASPCIFIKKITRVVIVVELEACRIWLRFGAYGSLKALHCYI